LASLIQLYTVLGACILALGKVSQWKRYRRTHPVSMQFYVQIAKCSLYRRVAFCPKTLFFLGVFGHLVKHVWVRKMSTKWARLSVRCDVHSSCEKTEGSDSVLKFRETSKAAIFTYLVEQGLVILRRRRQSCTC
jgi:hypothetical protein